MKSDKLKPMTVLNAYNVECDDNDLVYRKAEVDQVIARLEADYKDACGHFYFGPYSPLENPLYWPDYFWRKTLENFIERGCVPFEDLKEYAGETSRIYALDIDNVYQFSEIYKFEDLGLKRPPQSWCYTHFNMTTCKAFTYKLRRKNNV